AGASPVGRARTRSAVVVAWLAGAVCRTWTGGPAEPGPGDLVRPLGRGMAGGGPRHAGGPVGAPRSRRRGGRGRPADVVPPGCVAEQPGRRRRRDDAVGLGVRRIRWHR